MGLRFPALKLPSIMTSERYLWLYSSGGARFVNNRSPDRFCLPAALPIQDTCE